MKVKGMSYCPKCGAKIDEKMAFCPKCGAPLKVEQPPTEPRPAPTVRREEKAEKREKEEKREKREKREKTEKREKREFAFIGPLIGGLILIFLGLMFYFEVTGLIVRGLIGALFLILVGVLIIIGVLYAAMTAARRHPKT